MMRKTSMRGFAIPSAIFLIVVLAALGGFLVSFTTGQHIGLMMDVQGERAWQAAHAGIDLARYRVTENIRPWAPKAASDLQSGQSYKIASVGTTDFTLAGAGSNTIGTVFTATAAASGSGTATAEPRPSVDCTGVAGSFKPSGTETLDGFGITVTCAYEKTEQDGQEAYTFEVSATACNFPNADNSCPGDVTHLGYVERTLEAIIGF